MDWEEIPDAVAGWTEAIDDAARAIKRAAADVYTSGDVGYYCHPGTGRVALFAREGDPGDLALCKAAAARALGHDAVAPFLSHQDLADPDSCWVKTAYSPSLRRLGELLNFFPGQYPGGIPNAPSPAAAMLTSGLVGAGLGYGAGRLARHVLPEGYGEHLGRTGAILGGLAGIAPGAAWGAASGLNGHSPLEGWPLDTPAGADPAPDASPTSWIHGANALPAVSGRAAAAIKQAASTFGGFAEPQDPTPLDVHIDALGRTLWESGASPQLAGSTMGAMYAAQQLPDPRSRPNLVTAGQLGQLAMRTSGDYMQGLLVGKAINAVVGTPWSAPAFGAGATALGILGAVIPRLYGSG